jgi:Uma2 family endonuclease
MPDNDRIDRRLIAGRLVERHYPFRSPAHAAVVANLCGLLGNWEHSATGSNWVAYGYGCPYRLRLNPDTLLYFDASIIPKSLHDQTEKFALFIEGRPTVAIEIVDQSDDLAAVTELVDAAMDAGVPLLWLIDPDEKFVEVHRPNCGSIVMDQGDDMVASFVGPELCIPVSALFE